MTTLLITVLDDGGLLCELNSQAQTVRFSSEIDGPNVRDMLVALDSLARKKAARANPLFEGALLDLVMSCNGGGRQSLPSAPPQPPAPAPEDLGLV